MDAADLERAAARHWRAPEEERLGDWLLRAAGGFTGRANSALAVGAPGTDLAGAIDAVVAWYRARNLPPMVAVPLIGPAYHRLDALLAERRWALRSGAATVMTAELAAIPAPPPAHVHLAREPGPSWLARYHYRGSELPPIARTLLMSAPAQYFVSIRDSGASDGGSSDSGASDGGDAVAGVAAVARLSLDGDWAGMTAVEVSPAHRRKGLGTAITLAACSQARRYGARRVFLQVENANAPARALYRRVGFRDSHSYHYRVAPSQELARAAAARGLFTCSPGHPAPGARRRENEFRADAAGAIVD